MSPRLSRRHFLQGLAASSVAGTLPAALAISPKTKFRVAMLRYAGGDWNPRPSAPMILAQELRSRTSIDVRIERVNVGIRDPELFYHPMVVLAGSRKFSPWSETQRARMKKFLTLGGFILADSSEERDAQSGFDGSLRQELKAMFPSMELQKIPADHLIYRCFYRLHYPAGRTNNFPYLEGFFLEKRVCLVYSRNDLLGAMARDNFGNWRFDVVPGGDVQREASIRLAVNTIMYALCLDYKNDQVHIDYLLHKRRWRIR